MDSNIFSKKLEEQLNLLEGNVSQVSNHMRDIENYMNVRINKLRNLIQLTKSKNWTDGLAVAVDLFDEIQRVIDRVKDIEDNVISLNPVDEVLIDSVKFINGKVDVR